MKNQSIDHLLDKFCKYQAQLLQSKHWDEDKRPEEIGSLQNLFKNRFSLLQKKPVLFSQEHDELKYIEQTINSLFLKLEQKYLDILIDHCQSPESVISNKLYNISTPNYTILKELQKNEQKEEMKQEQNTEKNQEKNSIKLPKILAFCPYMQDYINILTIPQTPGGQATLQSYLLNPKSNEENKEENLIAYNWLGLSITQKNDVFLIGGTDGKSYQQKQSDQILKFDFEKKTCSQFAQMGVPRDVLGVCLVKHFIYIVEGRDDTLNYITLCERLNTLTGQIQRISDCNMPAGQPCLVPYKDCFVYKFGGWKARYVPNDTIERYDILSDRWNVLFFCEKIELNACMGGALVDESKILIFGGWREDFSCCSNELRVFEISEKLEEQVFKVEHTFDPLLTCSGFWYNHVLYDGPNKFYVLENIQSNQLNGTFLSLIQRILCFDNGVWSYINVQGTFEFLHAM